MEPNETTEPEGQLDIEGLPELTAKQLAFVQGVIGGKNLSDAYRAAYDCSGMSKETISAEASKLKAHHKTAPWLRNFQRIGADRAAVSLESHLAELARGRELAYGEGQISAGVQAEHYRGKAAGLYGESVSLASSISDTALVLAIRTTLGSEAAEAIAVSLGGNFV